MSEDGEAVEGLIPKIQEAFDKYTQGSVSVIDKQNGGLNSTFEILQDLSKVYPTLTDEAKAYLNEAIAGNRQNKVLVAIMENWKNVEGSINAATNSLGSANRENEKYLNSINGKISQFNSSVQMLFKNTIDSNFIKWVVDTGTAVISLVDKLGLIPTVIGAATLAFALFSKTAFAGIMSKLASVIVTKLVVSLHMATGAAVGLATALSVLAPVAIATAILAIISGIKYLAEATERQREVVRKLKEEYDTLTTSLDENESKQQKVIDRLKELYALRNTNKITDVEKEELIRLENVNTELQRQIEYEKALKAIKGEELERETLELSDKKIYRSRTQIPEIKQGRSYELPPMLTLSEKAQEDLNIIKDYTTQIEELKSARDEDKISAEEYGKQLEELQLKRKNEIESLNELIAKIAEENEGYGSTEEGNKKKAANEAIIKSIQDYIISLNAEKNALDGLAKPSSDAGSAAQAQAKSVEELTKIYDSATDTIDDYSSSAKELASVYEDVNEGEKISSDTLLKLITQYPQYASQITNLNSSKEAGISITKLLWEVEKQRSIEKLKADRLELESERDKLEGYRKAYIALSNIMGSVPQGVLDSYKEYENINKQIGGITEAINILNNTAIDTFSSKKSKKSSKSEYTPSTEQSALKDLLDADKISLQTYYDRLLALEKSQYSDYANKSADQLEQMLRSKNEKIAKRTEEYLSLFNERTATKASLNDVAFKAFDTSLTPLTDNLSQLKSEFDNLEDTDFDEKLQIISQETQVQNELIRLYSSEITNLTNLYKQGEISTEQYTDRLSDLAKSSNSAKDALSDLGKKTKDVTQAQQSYAEKLAKDIIDTQKSIDKSNLDSFKSASDEKIKSYQNEIDKLEEQNDLIEEQEKRAEHLLNIQEAQAALLDAQNEKNTKILRQKDDGTYYWSLEANPQKVKQAQDDLKKTQEDYTNWQRNVNLKKQKKYWEDLIQQEKDAQKVQEDLFNQHYANVELLASNYLDNLKNIYGDKWDSIIELQKSKLAELESLQGASVSDTTVSDKLVAPEKSKVQSDLADKQAQKAQLLVDIKGKSDAENMPKIIKIAQLSREIAELEKKVARFDTGGYTGSFDGGKLAVLHEKELVLNKIDTSNLLKVIDITRQLVGKIKMPNFSNLATAGASSSNNTNYNIHVDKVVSNNGQEFINTLSRFVKTK